MFLQDEKRPKVGVGVIVMKDGKVLIGKRRGTHGEGRWGFPGGHLEWGESFEQAAIREVKEETGLDVQRVRFLSTTNDIMAADEKHYITVFMLVEAFSGTERVMEPEKCESWHWFEWDDMPEPRFLPIDNLIATGYHPDGSLMTAQQRLILRKLKAHVKATFEGEGSGHDWWHIYRVWKNAKAIAKNERVDQFVVEAGALLHDIADWKDHDGDLEAGPREGRRLLEQFGASEEDVDHICEIIRRVSFKGAGVETPMQSKEGEVVQDADRLDAMGAIGVARAFTWGGSRGRLMYDPSKPPQLHDSFEAYKSDNGHTINHFYEKLLLLKDRMNTEAGKKIASQRHAFLERYLEQFFTEWNGESKPASKLVRDRIPEIIQQNGDKALTHIAESDEYALRLREKLSEEVQEFFDDNNGEELADVLEVVYALAETKGISRDALERMRQEKEQARGAFRNRVVLDETS